MKNEKNEEGAIKKLITNFFIAIQKMEKEKLKKHRRKEKALKKQTINDKLSKKPIYKINYKRNVKPNRKIINKKESR